MKIENIKLADLKPLERNVRKHGEHQIEELIKSLNQFGQTRAFVVDENNTILIGNGLYEAMLKRGDKTGAVYRVKGLSETMKKKLVLSDNKVFSLGVDDFDNVEALIQEITAEGDFDIAGFDEDTLKSLVRTADEVLSDVMNYGVLETPPKKSDQQTGESEAYQYEQETAPVHYEASTDEVYQTEQETAEEVKTIVCPGCGEVIRL